MLKPSVAKWKQSRLNWWNRARKKVTEMLMAMKKKKKLTSPWALRYPAASGRLTSLHGIGQGSFLHCTFTTAFLEIQKTQSDAPGYSLRESLRWDATKQHAGVTRTGFTCLGASAPRPPTSVSLGCRETCTTLWRTRAPLYLMGAISGAGAINWSSTTGIQTGWSKENTFLLENDQEVNIQPFTSKTYIFFPQFILWIFLLNSLVRGESDRSHEGPFQSPPPPITFCKKVGVAAHIRAPSLSSSCTLCHKSWH